MKRSALQVFVLGASLAVSIRADSQAPTATQQPAVEPVIKASPLPPLVKLPVPPTAQDAAPKRPVTAAEAARTALLLQPDLIAARASVSMAQGRTRQSRSGLLPQLGVGAAYTHTESIRSGGSSSGGTGGTGGGSFVTVPGYQISTNLQQLLFDFGRTRSLVKQSEDLERAAHANLKRVQSDLVYDVKLAFYSLVQDLRLVEVNEANVRSQDAQLALARARLDEKVGLPLDVVRAQTAVSEAILNLTLARNNASISRTRLATIMGLDARTPIETADSAEPAPRSDDVNEMATEALAQRPEAMLAAAELSAAEKGLAAARHTNSPSLAANLGLSARGNSVPPTSINASIGASISWSPVDSGFTQGRVQEAKALVDSARAAAAQVRLTIVEEVSTAYLNLRTAEQRTVTTEAQVTSAQEAVRLAEGRYRAGLGTFLDVIDTQSALLAARTSRVNAVTSIELARAALARAEGGRVPRA